MKIHYTTRSDPGVTNANCTRASLLGTPSTLGVAFKGADYGNVIQHYPAPLSVRVARIAWGLVAVMLIAAVALWASA